MKNDLFKQLVEVKNTIKALQEQEDALKGKIIDELKNNNIDKLENDLGKFTIANRTSYTYSEKVQGMEEKVKLAKLKEVEKGIAEVSITNYLLYTAPKQK